MLIQYIINIWCKILSGHPLQSVGGMFEHLDVKQKCALLDILHEIPANSGLLYPEAAPPVAASLFKKQSMALLTTFRSGAIAEADPAVTIKVNQSFLDNVMVIILADTPNGSMTPNFT